MDMFDLHIHIDEIPIWFRCETGSESYVGITALKHFESFFQSIERYIESLAYFFL